MSPLSWRWSPGAGKKRESCAGGILEGAHSGPEAVCRLKLSKPPVLPPKWDNRASRVIQHGKEAYGTHGQRQVDGEPATEVERSPTCACSTIFSETTDVFAPRAPEWPYDNVRPKFPCTFASSGNARQCAFVSERMDIIRLERCGSGCWRITKTRQRRGAVYLQHSRRVGNDWHLRETRI